MFDRKKVLEDAPGALNKVDQLWEVTIEDNSIVARWKVKDTTLSEPTGMGNARKNYKFTVTLDEKGEWEERDTIDENKLFGMTAEQPGLQQGTFSLNLFGASSYSFDTRKGKSFQKSSFLTLGRDHKTGKIGMIKTEFDTKILKQSVRDYLTRCGWVKKGSNSKLNTANKQGYEKIQNNSKKPNTVKKQGYNQIQNNSKKPNTTNKQGYNQSQNDSKVIVIVIVALLAAFCIGVSLFFALFLII